MDRPDDRTAQDARPPLATLLVQALVLFAILRVGLSLLAVIIASTGVWSPCHFEEALNGWSTMPELLRDGPAFPLAGIWERWDACWYLKIATYGYEAGEESSAFFPAFPVAVRLVGTITALPYPVAGMIVNAIAFVAAITGLLRLVSASHGISIARRTALYLAIFPSAFFLLAPFSEALFLAATTWALVCARERRWTPAAILALLAGLTRAPGVLLALPLAWEALVAAREAGRSRVSLLLSGLAALAPVVAFAGFGIVAEQLAGRTPYEAQGFWGGTSFHPPWAVAGTSVAWIVERGDALQALNLVVLVGSGVLLAVGARRMPITYSLYAWPPLLLLAIRIQPTPLTSTTRLVLGLYPIFLVLALLTERPWLRRGWIALSLTLLVLLAASFLRGDFVA